MAAEPTKSRDFYSVQEVAAILQVADRTVRRLIERGELPYYAIGRSIRIRKTDLDGFLTRVRVVEGRSS